MCGLISVFCPDAVTPPTLEDLKDDLEVALESIKHRGPDSQGVYLSPDARVGALPTFLRIVDPSDLKQDSVMSGYL
jgi:asparagine synthetase B (glutamine-hydrolysing)